MVLPALGESVTEGTVTRWLKAVGDSVAVDEPLVEVSTDKVDTEIPSPVAGTLLEITVGEDAVVQVGGTLGVVGAAGAAPAAAPAPAAPAPAEAAPPPLPPPPRARTRTRCRPRPPRPRPPRLRPPRPLRLPRPLPPHRLPRPRLPPRLRLTPT